MGVIEVKRIITTFLISFLAIFANPTILSASDYFEAKNPNFAIAEKLINQRQAIDHAAKLSENPPISQEINTVWTSMTEASSPFEPRKVGAPATGSQTASYQVTVTVNNVTEYNKISSNLSENDIYRFKNLIFAHNAPNLFGNLSNLKTGQVIAISDGVTTTDFRVAEIELYSKTNGILDNDPEFINKLAAHAMGHDLALLTCAGTPLGHGDATHRLVVYVDTV